MNTSLKNNKINIYGKVCLRSHYRNLGEIVKPKFLTSPIANENRTRETEAHKIDKTCGKDLTCMIAIW